MMDDLASAEFYTVETEARAVEGTASLLSGYVLSRGTDPAFETDPIRWEMGAYETPTSLFMIYMKFDDTGQLIVRQFRYDDFRTPAGAGLTVAQAEDELLGEARQDQPGGAHYDGSNFLEMLWTRPYYLTFVIDNPNWEFYWDPSPRHEAMRLLKRKDVPGSFKEYEEKNFTFYNADPNIPLAADGDAFRVTNHFRDASAPIVAQSGKIDYCFELYLRAPFKDPSPGTTGQPTHVTVLIDPDGQNQGPRV